MASKARCLIACVALCASSIASADYLEFKVFGQVARGVPLKFWEYTGYFDLDATMVANGEFESVYGFGGRMQSPLNTPFIMYSEYYDDQLPATLALRYHETSSFVEIRCRNDFGPSVTMFIRHVDPVFWMPQPSTLPSDPEAYRIVPRQGGDESSMELTFRAPGHNISWRHFDDKFMEERGPVFYSARIVEELPASAFSPLDFNRDGQINFFDVSRFVELYLEATN